MSAILKCIDRMEPETDNGELTDENDAKTMIQTVIYRTFWLISLPLQCIFAIASRICFCYGCSRHVGRHSMHLLVNSASTILLLAHFSFGDASLQKSVSKGVSAIVFGGLISGETLYGLAIIGFALINFVFKIRKLHQSHAKWKVNQNESSASIRIKDLQIVIVDSSDTIFKILSGIAVVIGSKYSGTDLSRSDALSAVVDCIFAAAIMGPLKQITQLLHEYLDVALFSVRTKGDDDEPPVSNKLHDFVETKFDPESAKNGIFHFVSEKSTAAAKSKYSKQKTILWTGFWGGLKLLFLAIQQIFGFIAASLLISMGNDIASFLAFVLLCNLGVIIIAITFCTKFERVAIGLCCKLYCCCLYDLCPDYCEHKMIILKDDQQIEKNHVEMNKNKKQTIAIAPCNSEGESDAPSNHENNTNKKDGKDETSAVQL
eukprot:704551_1